jgi:hypothetical protein
MVIGRASDTDLKKIGSSSAIALMATRWISQRNRMIVRWRADDHQVIIRSSSDDHPMMTRSQETQNAGAPDRQKMHAETPQAIEVGRFSRHTDEIAFCYEPSSWLDSYRKDSAST